MNPKELDNDVIAKQIEALQAENSSLYKQARTDASLFNSATSYCTTYYPSYGYGDMRIDKHSFEIAMSAIVDIHAAVCKRVVKTNLDKIRTMSAENLAEFIIKEAKRQISGVGNPVEELTEWLNSDV